MGAISFRQAMVQKLEKRANLKYGLSRISGQWCATIIGPFHHRLYGTCAQGSTDKLAIERLERTLLLEGWLGGMTFSDVDEQDAYKNVVRKQANVNIRAAEVVGQQWV